MHHSTKRIADDLEFVDISRQRKYQIRRMREGRCTICGQSTEFSMLLCHAHAEAKGIRVLGKNGARHRKWQDEMPKMT